MLRSLKDANRDSLGLLEQKKMDLNMAQSEIQTLKYEQSVIISKVRPERNTQIESIRRPSELETSDPPRQSS